MSHGSINTKHFDSVECEQNQAIRTNTLLLNVVDYDPFELGHHLDKNWLICMSRKYPKFLWSNPTKTKSIGPFIIHALAPRFICKPVFNRKRNLIHTTLIEVWQSEYDAGQVDNIMNEIPAWFNQAGRDQSLNEDDRLIFGIFQLEFLKDYRNHFTVEEARMTLQVLFPTKSKTICKGHSSYGLKHLLEAVSNSVLREGKSGYKYCSNETIIKAFELEGFKWTQDGPYRFMNLLSKEVKQAYKIFRY